MADVIVNTNVSLPNGAKIITNDGEWLTVAKRKTNGVISLITVESCYASGIDFHDESKWFEMTHSEIASICRQMKIKV